jgi:hypothetical protein
MNAWMYGRSIPGENPGRESWYVAWVERGRRRNHYCGRGEEGRVTAVALRRRMNVEKGKTL